MNHLPSSGKWLYRVLVLASVGFPTILHAKTPPPPTPMTQAPVPTSGEAAAAPTQVFNVDQNPGRGSLQFTQGQKTVPIPLGPATGYYALGMIFDGSALPPAVSKKYRQRQIIQIALGTNSRKLTNQVPQFIAISIVSGAIPKQDTTYKLVVPGTNDNPLQQMAMMMFMAPDTPSQQPDEEKLKSTYFAETGTLKLSPQDLPRSVEIETPSRKLKYKLQMMKLEIESTLVTPFNSQENDITGVIVVPVYWPDGKEARALMRQLASESLAGGGPVPAAQAYTPKPLPKK